MTTPRRVPDPGTGGFWLLDIVTGFMCGVAGAMGYGAGEYRRFRPAHLQPRGITADTLLTALDDGVRLRVDSGTPVITVPTGLHGAFEFEVQGACTVAWQSGLTTGLDQRVINAGVTPWLHCVVDTTDATTGVATRFALRGVKAS